MYTFRFTNTLQDQLEAYTNSRTQITGIRPSIRMVLTLWGVINVVLSIVVFLSTDKTWLCFVWLLVGMGFIYYNFIKDWIAKNQIKHSPEIGKIIELHFDDAKIDIYIKDRKIASYNWKELVFFRNLGVGVSLYFESSKAMCSNGYIPNKAFSNLLEKEDFLDYLLSKMSID